MLKIAVDFDGTICEHEFPDIGRPVPGAFEWLAKWRDAGASLMLWTMRSDGQQYGNVLTDAVRFCEANGIEFDSVNEGLCDRAWTDSPKIHANIYVDDAAFGCPLIESKKMDGRPMVDWEQVGPAVLAQLTPSEP